MTSMRLVGAGFLLALAILPAMLLNLAGTAGAASQHEEHRVAVVAAASGGVSRARATSLDDHPRKPWEGAAGNAKPEPAAAQTPRGSQAPALLEFYLPTPSAVELAANLLGSFPADAPRPILLNFGSATDKDSAADDIDPFVAVEAGRRRRTFARAMVDQRATPGPVAVLSSTAAATPAAGDAPAMQAALARAASDPAGARLELKRGRTGDNAASAAPIRVEYTARPLDSTRTGKPGELARLNDDIVLNIAIVDDHELPASAAASNARVGRVLTFKSFKIPRDGSGAAELIAPAPAPDAPVRARRIIGYLQHAKTMRVLAAAELELKD